MAPPRELPGMYWDEQKQKYFRIQPEHKAPPGAAHSRSAVKASKKATELTVQAQRREHRDRAGRISRIDRAGYPNLNLHLRLGRQDTRELLGCSYAGSLQSRSATVANNKRAKVYGFTVTIDGKLLTLYNNHDRWSVPAVRDSSSNTPVTMLDVATFDPAPSSSARIGIAATSGTHFAHFRSK